MPAIPRSDFGTVEGIPADMALRLRKCQPQDEREEQEFDQEIHAAKMRLRELEMQRRGAICDREVKRG